MKHNIYEIPKVHPFIKTLEKVKALRDNLDEHIEITSKLWEDGKASEAYYYSAEILRNYAYLDGQPMESLNYPIITELIKNSSSEKRYNTGSEINTES